MMLIQCELCGREVNPRDENNVYQWTEGWVMLRSGGGGHSVSLPKRHPRWAHRKCVDTRAKGVPDLELPGLF